MNQVQDPDDLQQVQHLQNSSRLIRAELAKVIVGQER